MIPLDYRLCCQTVTLYRRKMGLTNRKILLNCWFSRQTVSRSQDCGPRKEKLFSLIVPGHVYMEPGDRIYEGVGPETVDWDTFLPALVPEVYELSFAQPCVLDGAVTHWEAGNRKEYL